MSDATMTTEARRVDVSPDGYLYDEETGEVLGLAEAREAFEVRSPEAADWVLGLIAAEEARVKAIEMRRAALLANIDAMLVDPRNRLAYLERRFRAELEEQARRDIAAAGGKAKTAKYPHGQVAFRQTAGSCEITDAARALDYVEEWAPAEVKKSVGIGAVKVAIEAEKEATGEEPAVAPFFRAAEPREKAYITTGIGKEPAR